MITRQHSGVFGLDAAVMIGFMLLGVASLMLMHTIIIEIIVPNLAASITAMPTFYDYDEERKTCNVRRK